MTSVLPHELTCHIFSFLGVRETVPLDSVCILWRRLLLSDHRLCHQRNLGRLMEELLPVTSGIRHVLNHNRSDSGSAHLEYHVSRTRGWTVRRQACLDKYCEESEAIYPSDLGLVCTRKTSGLAVWNPFKYRETFRVDPQCDCC